MKTIKLILLFCITTGLAWGGPVTEESIRELLKTRSAAFEQADVETIAGVYTTNAAISTSWLGLPEEESKVDPLEFAESFSKDMKCTACKTDPVKIEVAENAAVVAAETHLSVIPSERRKRIMVYRIEERFGIAWIAGHLKITSGQMTFINQTLEPDKLSERIMKQVRQAGGIKKENAIKLLEESGCRFTEGDGNKKKTTISARFNMLCGDEIPALAACMPGVQSLDLTGCTITDKGLADIGKIKTLESLSLMGPKITDEGIAQLAGLEKLESLTLIAAGITDASLERFADFPAMKRLIISGADQVTDAGLEQLTDAELIFLRIENAQITDAGLAHLEKMDTLTGIYLAETKVTYKGAKQLKEKRPELYIGPASLSEPCADSRRRLEFAKKWWAQKENKKVGAIPTQADLEPYLKRQGGFATLTCEDGGTFTIHPVGTGAECSIHGKTKAQIPKEPLKGLSKEDFDIDGAKVGRWTMDLTAAKKLAAEKRLPILLNFTGSDWCYWCKLMEKNVFIQPEWKAYAKDSIIMVLIDFPRDESAVPEKYKERNASLKNQYGISGYPTFVLLKPDGKTELGKLKAGRDKTAKSFIGEINAAIEKAHESNQQLDYPGFRPPTEQADVFVQNIETAKFAVLPSITRYVQPRENKVSVSRTRVALNRIVEFLAVNNLGTAEPARLTFKLSETPQGGQFAVFNQTIEAIAGQLENYQGEADYILVLDIIRVYRDAWGLQCYILDREGRNVFSFLLNSHHKPFVDAAIRVKTSNKEGREKLFADCTELILKMLHQQIITEREIAAYKPDPSIVGRYIGEEDPAGNYLILNLDGTCQLADDGQHSEGTYAIVGGSTLVLIKDGQRLPIGRFEDGKLITNDGRTATKTDDR